MSVDFLIHEGMLCVLIRIASLRRLQYTIFSIKKKITLNSPKSAAVRVFFF